MSEFIIGIDAGGTSVRALLAVRSDDGAVRLRCEAKGAADADGGPDALRIPLFLLLEEAGADEEAVISVCAGITKISRAGVKARWEAWLAEQFPAARKVSVVPDFVAAFHSALPNGVGLCVVAGTGSVVYGENGSGKTARAGGRGWEWGDEGSGAWLTGEMIRRTLRAWDGLENATPLTSSVRNLILPDGDDAGEFVAAARVRCERDGRGFLVPHLLHSANEGDAEARNLYKGAAGWLAAYAGAARKRLEFAEDKPTPVAVIGGLWEAGEWLRKPFGDVLPRFVPKAEVVEAAEEPVYGAVRLASQLLAQS